MVSQSEDLSELGLNANNGVPDGKAIRLAYLRLSKSRHPDKGGTKEAFQRLSNAYQRLISNYRYPAATRTTSSRPETNYRRPQWNSNTAGGTRFKPKPSNTARPEPPPASSSQGTRQTSSSQPDQDPNASSGNRDPDDYEFWDEEYFYFFRRQWKGHCDRDKKFDDYTYFTRWETATRQQRARERYQNVKRGYDYRDKRAVTAANGKSSRAKCCTFCGKNRPITKRDAEKHGLAWNEYNRNKNKYGYPTYRTCWACKNSHNSVLTEKQAIAKFVTDKVHVLEGTNVFLNLRQMERSFHHQPVTDYAEITLNSEYFWYPDVEKEALARGWRPRGTKRLEVPWIPKNLEPKRPPIMAPTESQRMHQTDQTRTPKRRRKTAPAAIVTVSGGRSNTSQNQEEESNESSQKLRPMKLFDDQVKHVEEKTGSKIGDGDRGDWRVSGARDY